MTDPRIAQRLVRECHLDAATAKMLFDYDPTTGNLLWSKASETASRDSTERGLYRRVSGTVAGTVNSNGYICISANGVRFLAHRVVWLIHTGVWPKDQLDHINTVRVDNRIENLREVSNRLNHANRTDNKSGHVGVIWDKLRSKWKAYARIDYKMHNISRYETAEEAVKARQEYMKKYGV